MNIIRLRKRINGYLNADIGTDKSIRIRIICMTLGVLLFLFLKYIPAPFIKSEYIYSLYNGNEMAVTGAIGFNAASFLMTGMSSYITAGIIMQMLSFGVESINVMMKAAGGEEKMKRYTLVLGTVISLVTSYVYLVLMKKADLVMNDPSPVRITVLMAVYALGTVLSVLIGEWITKRGPGNGSSILIAAGTLTGMVSIRNSAILSMAKSEVMGKILFIAVVIIIIAVIIMCETGYYKIPVVFGQSTARSYTGEIKESYVPLKINLTGIIPVIYASMLSGVCVNLLNGKGKFSEQGGLLSSVITMILISVFTFIYSRATMDPVEIAKNFQISAVKVVDVNFGKESKDFMKKTFRFASIVNIIYFFTAIVLPSFIFSAAGFSPLPMTSFIIIINVITEVYTKINNEMKMKESLDDKII